MRLNKWSNIKFLRDIQGFNHFGLIYAFHAKHAETSGTVIRG